MAKKTTSKDLSQLSLRPPVAVQLIAILAYTGFAIPVSIIAMDQFGTLGLGLVLFIVWGWTHVANLGSTPSMHDVVERLRPELEAVSGKPSGNTSFDAYRTEMMRRLETEQTKFEGFLERLRDARDKSEFDTFMADREKTLRDQRTLPSAG